MSFTDKINNYLETLKNTLDGLNRDEINKFAGILLDAYAKNATIYICGNGGSATTASHFACDINKGASCGSNRRFKVIALTDNLPSIMAYANDVSYDVIFIEQLKNYLNEGDLVIGISGSGNSPNVIKAIDYANQVGGTTIGITGFDGGMLKRIAKYSVNANIDDMQISEDIHVVLVHLMMKILSR